jgi:hypothetical protein
MPDDDALVDELAAEILRYLEAHPDAADSLDGIVQWWIVHERFLRGVAATGRALERLVADGRIDRVVLPDGGVLFRARKVAGSDGGPS